MLKGQIILLKKEITNIFYRLKQQGSFTRNFSYLFSGRIITTLLSFAITPILTRLYAPDAYGYFAFFNAIAMNFMVISSLSYENTLVIAEDKEKFKNLLIGCLLLTTISGVILTGGLGLVVFYPGLKEMLSITAQLDIRFLLFIVAGALLFSYAQILAKWNVRLGQFKFASRVWLFSQVTNRSVSLGLGFFSAPPYGLIVAENLGKIVSLTSNLAKNLSGNKQKIFTGVTLKSIYQTLWSYKNYPRFVLPSRYLGTLINQLPIFFIAFYFGKELTGNFALTISIVNLPVLLIANTLSSIFLKKCADLSKDKFALLQFIKRGAKLLAVICLPYYLFLILFAYHLFPFAFGANWQVAGEMAMILATFTIVQVFQVFAVPIFQVFNVERRIFSINFGQLIFSLIACIPGIIMSNYLLMIGAIGLIQYIFGWYRVSAALKILNGNIYKLISFISVLLLLTLSLKLIFS